MYTHGIRFSQPKEGTAPINEARIDVEIVRLNARLDELEKNMSAKMQRIQNDWAADFKRLELRVEEMERRSKMLQLRLEAAERQLRFELARNQQPELGFDKIGIA